MESKEKKVMTLCLIYRHPRILLGMKKRGFGAGRWNGFGGKVEEKETIEEAAKRELVEESGLEALQITQFGIINFEFQGDSNILEVHIFHVNEFKGEPKETEEMKPQWFNVDEIPFKDMWSDDIHWMPLFLRGKKFKGRFLFGELDRILEQKLSEVEEM